MSQSVLFAEEVGHDVGCRKKLRVPPDVRADALIDGCYRYTLCHIWEPIEPAPLILMPLVMWLMMNPSKADMQFTDSTVAKCGRLSRRWGFGGLLIGNVCAYRATDSKRLLEVADPVGPQNDYHLLAMAERAELIVVAHGKLPRGLQCHAEHATMLLAEKHAAKMAYLRRTPTCANHHPLYLPEDSLPIAWSAP